MHELVQYALWDLKSTSTYPIYGQIPCALTHDRLLSYAYGAYKISESNPSAVCASIELPIPIVPSTHIIFIMYLRAVHAEGDIAALQTFIKDNPLGILISATPSSSSNFPVIQCTHIPWVIDIVEDASEKKLGKVRGHMARANPHSKALVEAVQGRADGEGEKKNFIEQEVSVLFNGPAHHYVTPKFYSETKPATGKVVPTWNYSAVQIYGRARIYHDTSNPATGSYLQNQVEALTRHTEASIMGYNVDGGEPGLGKGSRAWAVGDAPKPFVEVLKKAIIGVEIEIDRLEGKYKMSQEMSEGDRKGVADGFRSLGNEVGEKMAQTVEERGAKKEEARRQAGKV